MKRFLLGLAILFILLVLQVAVAPSIMGSWPVPQLMLIFVLVLAVQVENDFDLFSALALAGGLLADFFSSVAFGVFTVSFLLMALLAGVASRYFIETGLNMKNVVLILLFSSVFLPLLTGTFSGRLPSVGFLFTLLLLSIPSLWLINKFPYVRAEQYPGIK